MDDRKKWGKWVSGCVVAAAVLLNSLTVLAYEDVQYWKVSEESTDVEEFTHSLLNNDVGFVPDGMEIPEEFLPAAYEIYPVLYNVQFVDEEGNIYPVEEEIEIYAICDHNYVSGTIYVHNKNSDGSCIMTYYNVQKCSKCGYTVRGELNQTIAYNPCPH